VAHERRLQMPDENSSTAVRRRSNHDVFTCSKLSFSFVGRSIIILGSRYIPRPQIRPIPRILRHADCSCPAPVEIGLHARTVIFSCGLDTRSPCGRCRQPHSRARQSGRNQRLKIVNSFVIIDVK